MKKAFTLIELLIVVAIIAILAAIAVPNFLEAQTRAKVSRAKADMRTLATALEAYRVDSNAYPSGNPNNVSSALNGEGDDRRVLERLSTPVAYITSSILPDPFRAKNRSGVINPSTGDSTPVSFTVAEFAQEGSYKYAVTTTPGSSGVLALTADTSTSGKAFWILWSAGPAGTKPQVAGTGLLSSAATDTAVLAWMYDATNGTISRGGIFRTGGAGVYPPDPGGMFFSVVSRIN